MSTMFGEVLVRRTSEALDILRAPVRTRFTEHQLDHARSGDCDGMSIRDDVVTVHGRGRRVCYQLVAQNADDRRTSTVRAEKVYDDLTDEELAGGGA